MSTNDAATQDPYVELADVSANAYHVRQALQQAVDQRGRHYSNLTSLAIRFENDDTSAERDTVAFVDMIKAIGHPPPKVLVLKPGASHMGFIVATELERLGKHIATLEGRTLVILHYAGHAEVAQDGTLKLLASDLHKTESFSYADTIDAYLARPSGVLISMPLEGADAVIIMVAPTLIWHHGLVAPQAGPWRCSPLSKLTRSLKATKTAAVPILQQTTTTAPSVPVSSRRDPLRPSDDSSNPGDPATQDLCAVLAVHINEDGQKQSVKEVVEWITNLPSGLGLRLKGLYATNSTGLLLEVPWTVGARLAGVPGFSLVFETWGGDQRRGKASAQTAGIVSGAENEAPGSFRKRAW
ncbi:MAG: hypothetical protein M1832_005462 [Thelocarpon impressellum]|nr:MAG: hypothetical protein M1832_005462 [Thelocarpon impressellum]